MTRPRVAVLGAGVMGAATALHLARHGVPVTVFDREDAPMRGASRWNEGKIHLGFLYAGDRSLATARAVLPGGLDFKDQVESLTACSLEGLITPQDDLYLAHRDSITSPDTLSRYYGAVAELVRSHVDAHRYLTDVASCSVERLTVAELEGVADPAFVDAGFRVPERSVDTNRVADAFTEALVGEGLIELAMGRDVIGVAPADDDATRWVVRTRSAREGPFDAVVNALWHGRPRIDRTVGHRPDVAEHHRYRVSLFVTTSSALDLPSAVLSVGAFGDVKRYTAHDFYLSWYSAGLLASSQGVDPPTVPALDDTDRTHIASAVFAALGEVMPWVGAIERAAVSILVEGGWVYSQGGGRLDDPRALVHRRHRLGISQRGSYFSVDTGKYSVAPTLAEHLARAIATV